MASVSLRSKSNLISALSKRYASSSAAAAASRERQASLPREPVRVTRLENGIVVASLENHSPVTRVAAVFNAGARDETHAELGAAHALRVYSSLATRNYSVFGLSRNVEQIGADLSVTSTCEQTTYLLQATRDNAIRGIDVLGDLVSRPEYRHWEIHDASPRFEFDLNVLDEQPEVRIVELTHRAAFRNALSNSLYAPRYNLHNLNSELLHEFRNRNFTSNRLTLVGVGIKHDDLVRHANLFRLPNASNTQRQQARYLGSEVREDNDSQLLHVTLSAEGVSASSKHALASAIAAQAFGAQGNRVKYSNGSSRLSKVTQPLAREPISVAAFNSNYSDAGLFGVHIVANKQDAGNVLKGVHKELVRAAKSGLSNEEVTRAKNALKAELSYNLERPANLAEHLGRNSGNVSGNVEDLFRDIDAVQVNDVNAFVQKLGSGRLSLAAVGDLSELPRLDELSA